WDFPYGHGLLIAIVAGIHVFISHFAIGGGLYLVITEWRARRADNREMLAALVPHSRFFLLLTLVFGTLTGVSIWFTIGLISPALTSSLIHIFVWGWAIEWVFFFVEIAAAMLYYYGWSRLDPKTHLRVGIIYFVAAYLSLIIINGIVAFMLTPGGWLENGNFWAGFFNPSYWQSVATRTGICILIAGLVAMFTGTRLKSPDQRLSMVRNAALWVLAGAVVIAPSLYWYISSLPTEIRGLYDGLVPILPQVLEVSLLTGAVAVGLSILLGLLLPRRLNWPVVLPLLLLTMISFTTLEWGREAARKPFGIPGYIYANGLKVADTDKLQGASMSQGMWFAGIKQSDTLALGRRLFQMQCRTCHSNEYYNGLGPKLNGWEREHIRQIIDRLDIMRGRMPAFVGDERDRDLLAAHLESLGSRFTQAEPMTGKQTFHKYCGICHTERNYRPLAATLEGLSTDDLNDILDDLQAYSNQMPTFTGSETERELLIEYILEFANPKTVAGGE
ncbi:MAG: c-type cytochrome, partial [bacterium]